MNTKYPGKPDLSKVIRKPLPKDFDMEAHKKFLEQIKEGKIKLHAATKEDYENLLKRYSK